MLSPTTITHVQSTTLLLTLCSLSAVCGTFVFIISLDKQLDAHNNINFLVEKKKRKKEILLFFQATARYGRPNAGERVLYLSTGGANVWPVAHVGF